MRSHSFIILTLCAVSLFFNGCGYQVGEIRPTVLKGIKTIAVQNFANETYEPRIETLAADTVIKVFQQDGTFQVVSDRRADAILYGTISNIQRRSVQSVLNNVLASSEFELQITLTCEVFDRVTGQLLMRQRAIGRTSFYTSADVQQDQRQAIPLAMHDAAVKLVSSVTEGF